MGVNLPKLQERKSQTGSAFIITIPKEYVDEMGWKKGDTLLFSKLDTTSLKLTKTTREES